MNKRTEREAPDDRQQQPEEQHRDTATMTTPSGSASTETVARAMKGERSGGTAAIADAATRAESGTARGTDTTARETPLFGDSESETFRQRWTEVQTGFVDEPRRAVEQADGLVAEVIQRLAQVFADERGNLEGQWDRGDDIDTEQLRVSLQRYRSFFERLLSA